MKKYSGLRLGIISAPVLPLLFSCMPKNKRQKGIMIKTDETINLQLQQR